MMTVEWGIFVWPDPEKEDEQDDNPPKKVLRGKKEFEETAHYTPLTQALTEFFKRDDDPRWDWATLTSDKSR